VHVYIVAAPIVLSSLSIALARFSVRHSWLVYRHPRNTSHLAAVGGALEDVCRHDIYTATLFATGPHNLTLQRPSAAAMYTRKDSADMGRVRTTCRRECEETGNHAYFSPSGPSITTSFERNRIQHCQEL
jgi:hypothetical protein